jgi:hypothetical protein
MPAISDNTVAMSQAKKQQRAPMSSEHKDALAAGRDLGRAVRRYLEALDQNKPKRGRKRTPDSIQKQLTDIEQKLPSADALARVQMIQRRIDLQRELDTKSEAIDMTEVEKDFLRAAKEYGTRKGITYAAWREAGVAPEVLRKAGIARAAS